MIRGISSISFRSDDEKVRRRHLQVLAHRSELDSRFAALSIRVIQQDAFLVVVDDMIVGILRLAADREESLVELGRAAKAALASELREDGVVEIDRIILDVEVRDLVAVRVRFGSVSNTNASRPLPPLR